MILMRSFEQIYRRIGNLKIALTVTLLFTCAFALWEIITLRELNSYITETLQLVNQIILNPEEPILIERLQEMIRQRRFEGSFTLTNSASERLVASRDSLRSFAQYLQNLRTKELNHVTQIIFWVLGFSLCLLAAEFLFSRMLIKTIRSERKRTEDLLKGLEDVSRFKNIELPAPLFKEETYYFAWAKQIQHNMDLVRMLSTIPLTATIEDFIHEIGKQLAHVLPFHRFSMAFIDEEAKKITAETAYFIDSSIRMCLKPGFSQAITETSLHEMIEKGVPYRIIHNLEDRKNSESTRLLLEEGMKSNLTVPLFLGAQCLGFMFLASKEKPIYTDAHGELFSFICKLLEKQVFYSYLIQEAISQFGGGFVNLVEFKDNETGNHVKRVAWYARLLAEKLDLHPKQIRIIYQFSPLHDIGKVAIPDRILQKPGPLSPEEWETMKRHVTYGEQVLGKLIEQNPKGSLYAQSLTSALRMIADHHERWDGTGYPRGKKNEEISLEGRILSLADNFDALTTVRPYKPAFSFEKSLRIIEQSKESQFDPYLVELFISLRKEIENIYEKLKD